MQDARVIPEDLASCQRLLQEAWSTAVELTDTCTTLHGNQEKLQQENEELQATVNHLLRKRPIQAFLTAGLRWRGVLMHSSSMEPIYVSYG